MRTIPTLSLVFAFAVAGCTIKIFNGGGDDDTRTPHADAGLHGSGGDFDGGGVYGADAGGYDFDAGCGSPPEDAPWWYGPDAGYYVPDAGCPNGFGSGGSGSACIE
ncbi:MAG TPA: hypothetical protein VH143_27900 [Kofleriaceae bacterium]|jgi:hypothetical protein|nr:hypothetical protein [Kofleriaceae bacterium]